MASMASFTKPQVAFEDLDASPYLVDEKYFDRAFAVTREEAIMVRSFVAGLLWLNVLCPKFPDRFRLKYYSDGRLPPSASFSPPPRGLGNLFYPGYESHTTKSGKKKSGLKWEDFDGPL